MSALDDELVEAVAEAIRQADYECEMAESVQLPVASWTEHQARAVLSVPALRDALARDAQVREIVEEFFAPEPHRSAGKPMRANNAFHDIAALYPEVASMLRDGKG